MKTLKKIFVKNKTQYPTKAKAAEKASANERLKNAVNYAKKNIFAIFPKNFQSGNNGWGWHK
jgi:hypothetical protein